MLKSRQKAKILWITLGLLACFFVAEWSVGLWSQSLSLQADAGHILSDITALLISLFASFLAQQPVKSQATFGHQRIEVFAALLNGLGLVAIATFISWEAIGRWQHPATILTDFSGTILNQVGLGLNFTPSTFNVYRNSFIYLNDSTAVLFVCRVII
ncbi:MAG: cation diffusion facilitator family transporter [Nostoc sp.]